MENQQILSTIKNKEAHRSVLRACFMFLVVLLFTVSTISAAFEFDNTKDYDAATKTVTIKNSFLHLIDLDSIANVTLTTPHVHNVFYGDDRLVAEFDIELFTDLYDLPFKGGIEYFDVDDNNKTKIKQVRVKVRHLEEMKQIPIYEERTDCKFADCDVKIIGYEEVPVYDWQGIERYQERYNMTKGKIHIGIFTDVEIGETIEFIPTWFNVRMEEFAIWNETFSENLMHYWGFEEDAGNTSILVDDRFGLKNGSNFNSPTWTTGINEEALDYSGASRYTNNFGAISTFHGTGASYTISFWLNQSDTGANEMVMSYNDDEAGQPTDEIYIYWNGADYGGAGALHVAVGGGSEYTTCSGFEDNLWHNIVIVKGSSTLKVYCDNVLNLSQSTNGNAFDTNTFTIAYGYNINTYKGLIDEVAIWNDSLSAEIVGELYDSGTGTFYFETTPNSAPTITLNNPTTAQNFTTNLINFNCSALESDSGQAIQNLTLLINNITNYTIGDSTSTFEEINVTYNLEDGNYNYSCEAWDNNTIPGQNLSEERSFNVHTTTPTISITNPTGNLSTLVTVGDNLTLAWTISETGSDITHIRNCSYTYNGVTVNLNQTLCIETNTTSFSYVDNVTTVTMNVTDEYDLKETNTSSFLIKITKIEEVYNTTTFESKVESYTINVSSDDLLTSANLIWNGTVYPGTLTDDGWTASLSMPLEVTNKSFYWNFIYAGSSINSTENTISIGSMNFSLCGGDGGTVPFINLTFKDESDLSTIENGTIATSTWVYWLDDITINKSYTFINNTANPSYAFCAIPADKTLNVDSLIQYEDAEGIYTQRVLNEDTINLTNSTTNQILYLIKSGEGDYVTFQVINAAEQPIEGVIVQVTRIIGVTETIVGYGTTNAAGIITFYLDPDFLHTFTFNTTGYDLYTTSLRPTETTWTINLGGGEIIVADDYNKGVWIHVEPTNYSLLNNTAYDFRLNLTSSFWEISEYGFVLSNSTGDDVAAVNATTNGGSITLNYNVGNDSDYVLMTHYYITSGNITNSTKQWYIFNTGGTDYSILKFIEHFNTYTDSGLFGLGKFGKGIIVFLIIFMFVGLMTYKYGITTPVGVMSVIFFIVAIADYIGMIPNPVKAVPNLPTVLIGLILISIWVREVYKQ